jgi:uncharacterized protein YlzI (FlbEa/FlbD family)
MQRAAEGGFPKRGGNNMASTTKTAKSEKISEPKRRSKTEPTPANYFDTHLSGQRCVVAKDVPMVVWGIAAHRTRLYLPNRVIFEGVEDSSSTIYSKMGARDLDWLRCSNKGLPCWIRNDLITVVRGISSSTPTPQTQIRLLDGQEFDVDENVNDIYNRLVT